MHSTRSAGGGQAAGDDETVAPVVAGAAQDHDERRPCQRATRPGRGFERASQLRMDRLGHRGAGGLHERVLGQAQPLRGLVDARHLIGPDEDRNAALDAGRRVRHARYGSVSR